MMPQREMSIAVIGDEDLVAGMRLAGVNRYHIVASNHENGEDIRKVVQNFIGDANIGVIALQEDYLPFIADIVRGLRQQKKVLPVIIEVPSKQGTRHGDVTLHYRTFIRNFVGFDVQL
jgi:vacuolar-type H+-ATPase subunit F/Vma7